MERERVMAALREKYTQNRNNMTRLSFPDLSKDGADRSKKFTAIRRKLHAIDIHFTLAFPLFIRFMAFHDYCKALEFIIKESTNSPE